MKIREIVAPLEAFAPIELAEDYDNVGLLVGDRDGEANSALVCLDITEEVVNEAINLGAKLIISHHPLIFRPVRAIGETANVDRAIVRAIRHGIAVYAAHTNLDRAVGGMSWRLAEMINIQNIRPLDDGGFGVIGELPKPENPLDFLRRVALQIGVGCVRHTHPVAEKISRVALVTGSGGEALERAIEKNADAFLTADLRHDRFVAASGRVLMADIGHFESEFCAIDLICEVISKKIPNFALHKSTQDICPVCYMTEN